MKIIINADDFGLNKKNTAAIVDAFGKNLITDTTLMANGEAFGEAVDAAEKFGLSERVGIHFNLTEGEPLTEKIKGDEFFCKDGLFTGKVNRYASLDRERKKEVYDELYAQAKKITESGIKISHADSHHHIHTAPDVYPVFITVAREFGIFKARPHRNIGKINVAKRVAKYFFNKKLKRDGFTTADYFGGADDLSYYGKIAESDKVLEIMVHPDYDKDGLLIDRQGDYVETEALGKQLAEALRAIADCRKICYREL